MSGEENPLVRQMMIYAQELKTIYDTERERRNELEAALRRLREQDELKTTFVDLLSHELRTPVTVIQGYLEVMSELLDGRLEGAEAEFLTVVLEQSNQLSHLIAELTDFTDLSRSEPLPQLEESVVRKDLSLLVQKEIQRLHHQIEQHDLRLTLEVPSGLPAANLEPARFRLILAHLLNNAVKFNRDGGWIKVSLNLLDETGQKIAAAPAEENQTEAPTQLRLSVANTGEVIAPEKLHLIFEAFSQGEATHTRSHGGLGLGLAIVRKAVGAFKGRVEVSSEVGRGTLFEVFLPYRPWQDPEQLNLRVNELRSQVYSYSSELRDLYEAERHKSEALAEANARLDFFLGKLLTAQEEERRRLAVELHDGLAQTLIFAHQMLELTGSQVPTASASAAFKRAQQALQEGETEVRKLIAGLRPDMLDRFGFVTALRDYLENLAREQNWQFSLQIEGDFGQPGHPALAPTLEDNLFRITQESLTNARKHAQTNRIAVRLRRGPQSVALEIQDWGKGLAESEYKLQKAWAKTANPLDDAASPPDNSNPNDIKKLGHFGLIGMAERARLLGGQLQIESAPGQGTLIRVEVPLEEVGTMKDER